MRHTGISLIFLVFVLGVWACENPSSERSSLPDGVAEGSSEEEEETSQEPPPPSADPFAGELPVEEPPPSDDPLGEEPPPSSNGIPVQNPPPSDEPSLAQTAAWQLILDVSVQDSAADTGVAYNRLVAGSEDSATADFDNAWDVRAFLTGPIQAYFAHWGEAGYDVTSEELWQDIRLTEVPGEWIVEVLAGLGQEVTLEWTLPVGEVSCGAYQFFLEDTDGQLGVTDMCSVSSLTFNGDGLMRQFVLSVM